MSSALFPLKGDTLRIERFKVQNFTSLANVELLDLPDLVVLIGKNSSGKSNLIDALALFVLEFGEEMERKLGNQDDYQHLFANNDTHIVPSPRLEATISLTTDEYLELLPTDPLGMHDEDFVTIHLGKELITDDAGDVIWNTFEISFGDFPVLLDEIMGEEEEGEDTAEFMRNLANFLKEKFQVIYTTESARSWPDRFSERPTIIDPDHVTKLWERSQSRGLRRRPWAQVSQKYESLAPNNQRPAGVANSIQVQEGALAVSVGMTGEGSQAILRLVDHLEFGAQVTAVEEPESHLHPALIKRVGQSLAEYAKDGRQLFISTHSPFLVDRSSLHNFFVVKKGSNGTEVHPMRSARLRDVLLDLGMKPSDVLFSDAILLVEGYSDELFFEALSNKIGVSLSEHHVKIVKANGKSRGRYKIEFWAETGHDAGLPLYLILDKNASAEAEKAIAKGQVRQEHCLILSKGDLEDLYPWPALKKALSSSFGKEVEEPIPSGSRVAKLKKLLGQRNAWKPPLADDVARFMTRDDVESELGVVANFLRKISADIAAD